MSIQTQVFQVNSTKVSCSFTQCKNLTCLRDDHLYCPYCYQIYETKAEVKDEQKYELEFRKCIDFPCLVLKHVHCTQCYQSFHLHLKEVL